MSSNYRLHLNAKNAEAIEKAIKASGKSRQVAISDVLRNSSDCTVEKEHAQEVRRVNYVAYIHYFDKSMKLSKTITLYRTVVVVLAFVAVTGWIL